MTRLAFVLLSAGCSVHVGTDTAPKTALEAHSDFVARLNASCASRDTFQACHDLREEYAFKSYECQKTTAAEANAKGLDCNNVERRLKLARQHLDALQPRVQTQQVAEREAQQHQDDAARADRESAQRAAWGLTEDDPPIVDIRRMELGLWFNASDEAFAKAYVARKKRLAEEKDQAAKTNAADAAACADTLASGFPSGSYSGEAVQRVTGRDGSKVFEWKSLTLKVDASGCATWIGYEHGNIAMPGDDARNIEKVVSTCINEGKATIAAGDKGAFKLAATVTSKASGSPPTKYHLWKCGPLNVQTDLSVDLRGNNCTLLGGTSDAQANLGGEIACKYSKPFDELKDRIITVLKDGSVRVPLTLADPSALVLRKVDKRQ